MSNIPRRIAPPPVERALLDWWAKDYDHVFIALNPFFRVPGFTPETAAYGPIHSDRLDFDDFDDLLENPPSRNNEAPEDFEARIKATGTPVTWSQVQAELGVRDSEKFARTVWLWTLESDRKDCDTLLAARLDGLARAGLYKPEEDVMPVIAERAIYRFLNRLGIDEVTIWNEWRDESLICPTEAFSPDEPPVALPSGRVAAISCDDPRLLLSWTMDGVEGFICMTDETRHKCPPEALFEGEYARMDTYPDWLNPIHFFDRVRPSRN